MTDTLKTAQAFFHACETGEGWDGCKQYCVDGATFNAQSGAIADIDTLEGYCDWMKGLLTLMPELLAAVDAAATKERPWHVLLLTRNVAPQGEAESAWTDGRGVATLDRTVTVVPQGGVESAAGGYILSASGANALLAGLTVHRALLGTALGDVPDTTVLSACDNAHFLPGCPENGVAAPASLVDVCAAPGAVLPAAAFPSHAESERVAEPMVLPPGAAEKALTPRARR